MAELSEQRVHNYNSSININKPKRRRKTVPRESPPQRSSIYRGVTRHRWTGRYEAHLWDKNCWNQAQNKKGRQVYLGAYDDEEAAAHAYDLAALKYWGPHTILNFPLSTYQKQLLEMESQSREEYIGSLRRKSNGFSRGVSKYRGVARHHHNGRWEARIGRVFGNKYLYLGTYATQEEAAVAYDLAAIEYRGLNAVTNFDLSRYIKWLKPISTRSDDDHPNNNNINNLIQSCCDHPTTNLLTPSPSSHSCSFGLMNSSNLLQVDGHDQYLPLRHEYHRPSAAAATTTSALGLLLQSSKFNEMLEMNLAAECSSTSTIPPAAAAAAEKCGFPDDITTQFDQETEDAIFGDLEALIQ